MPQGNHSRLQLKFCNAVNAIAEEQQIAMAFPELRCTFGGRLIVPDATVFLWQRIPFDANGEVENSFEIYPDWTVEILSPEQKTTKVIRNILHCLKHGSQLGSHGSSPLTQHPAEMLHPKLLLMSKGTLNGSFRRVIRFPERRDPVRLDRQVAELPAGRA